eukprot:GILK01005473.1.p1 GENE.GILK01005473.1~~GILK01005473.1.p1  ORF type:complete len:552 (+),score=160.98 GILK01005473.1:527-2182(+)
MQHQQQDQQQQQQQHPNNAAPQRHGVRPPMEGLLTPESVASSAHSRATVEAVSAQQQTVTLPEPKRSAKPVSPKHASPAPSAVPVTLLSKRPATVPAAAGTAAHPTILKKEEGSNTAAVPAAEVKESRDKKEKKEKGKREEGSSKTASPAAPSPVDTEEEDAEPTTTTSATANSAHAATTSSSSSSMQLKQMAGFLLRELKKFDTSVTSKVEHIVEQQMKALYDKLEAQRAERQKSEQQKMQQLLIAINNTMHNVVPQQIEKIERSVLEKVEQLMQSGSSVDPAKIAEAVRKPIHESFKKNFEKALVPAFEQAVQNMFSQMHGSFQAAVTERQQLESESATRIRALEDQLRVTAQTLNETAANFTRTIQETQATLVNEMSKRSPTNADASSGNFLQRLSMSAKTAPAPPALSPQEKVKAEINQHLAEHNYEQALSKALAAADLTILVNLCTRMNPRDLSTGKIPLNQFSLLSLIQQLGYDLATQTETKLLWLRESMMLVRPNDPEVAAIVPRIYTFVKTNLNKYIASNDQNSPGVSDARILLFIITNALKT